MNIKLENVAIIPARIGSKRIKKKKYKIFFWETYFAMDL